MPTDRDRLAWAASNPEHPIVKNGGMFFLGMRTFRGEVRRAIDKAMRRGRKG